MENMLSKTDIFNVLNYGLSNLNGAQFTSVDGVISAAEGLKALKDLCLTLQNEIQGENQSSGGDVDGV